MSKLNKKYILGSVVLVPLVVGGMYLSYNYLSEKDGAKTIESELVSDKEEASEDELETSSSEVDELEEPDEVYRGTTHIVSINGTSDSYHLEARNKLGGMARELGVNELEIAAASLRYGYYKLIDGTIPPSIAKKYYFTPTDDDYIFFMTYMPNSILDDTFLEIYNQGDSQYQLFRLILDGKYYYFLAIVENQQLRVIDKFGEFPQYNIE